ncbi:ABC transporter substrate-binding protein [Actinomadura luteofluorescens]|uniref:ABC transporter substrate-binding protein n=1 Tax=Actinomadura luteofluorescens TaxID=46163 RepID=UPI00363876B6
MRLLRGRQRLRDAPHRSDRVGGRQQADPRRRVPRPARRAAARAEGRRHHQDPGRDVPERPRPEPGPRRGSLDIGQYGDTPALIGRGQGLPTRLLSLNSVRLDAAIVARKDGGPASLKDLEGKRIGVQTGSYIHRYLLGALERAGVRPKEIIHMYTPAIIAALEKNAIDAAAWSPPTRPRRRRRATGRSTSRRGTIPTCSARPSPW